MYVVTTGQHWKSFQSLSTYFYKSLKLKYNYLMFFFPSLPWHSLEVMTFFSLIVVTCTHAHKSVTYSVHVSFQSCPAGIYWTTSIYIRFFPEEENFPSVSTLYLPLVLCLWVRPHETPPFHILLSISGTLFQAMFILFVKTASLTEPELTLLTILANQQTLGPICLIPHPR